MTPITVVIGWGFSVFREAVAVSLAPKAFATLLVLVEKSGHVVEKDELVKLVWPDSYVEEANVAQNIFKLRKVLGNKRLGEPYIETVPRRGYRFLGLVKRSKDDGGAWGRARSWRDNS